MTKLTIFNEFIIQSLYQQLPGSNQQLYFSQVIPQMSNSTKPGPQHQTSQQIWESEPSSHQVQHSDEIEFLDEVAFRNQLGKGDKDTTGPETYLVTQKCVSPSTVVDLEAKNYHTLREYSLNEISQSAEVVSDDPIGEDETNGQELHTKQRLCCRSCFIKGEELGPESRSIEFKNYNMSESNPILDYTLAKVISAFLNTNGGNVFIGVHETEQFRRFVVGGRYTLTDQENIYRRFRKLAQTINPDIIASQLFEINFMPVVHLKKGSIVPIKDLYLIKISVQQGHPTRLYTVLNPFTGYGEVCFRTENQVLTYKQMHEGLRFLDERLKIGKPLEKHFPHQNPCSIERQKQEFQTLLKKHKKKFKTDTRLQEQNNNQAYYIFPSKPKKIIIVTDPSPTNRILAQPAEIKVNESQQPFRKIDEEEPKNETQKKDEGKCEVQRFQISGSPFLFKQLDQQNDLTEPINY